MPRPRFQIPLATGLVLMLVAAGLLYLNLRDTYDPGWPLRVFPYYPSLSLVVIGEPSTSAAGSANPFVQPPPPTLFDKIRIKPLLANVSIALVFLALAALTSEHLLRQRAMHGTLRPRPHLLAVALFLALLIATLWLNTVQGAGTAWTEISLPMKSHERPRYFGWPFHFQNRTTFHPGVFYDVRSLVVTVLAGATVILLPAFTLHRLLHRTLHLHLQTAVLLMLAAAALVYLNTKYIYPKFETFGDLRLPSSSQLDMGWPCGLITHNLRDDSFKLVPAGLTANLLIALAILSLVLLLSEFLLACRSQSREATP